MNTLGRAGAERALTAFLDTLSPEEYEISLLVLVNRGEIYEEIPAHVNILNSHPDSGSVLSFGGRLVLLKTVLRCFFYHLKGFSLLGYLLRNLTAQLKAHRLQPDKLCWRIIANGTPAPNETYDLAVAYLEGGSTYFVADTVHAAKKAAFVHIDYRNAGYGKELDLDSYSRIDRIFSVSREAGESFCCIYPEYQNKCFLFRNILDTKRILSLSQESLAPTDPFCTSRAKYRLLTVGRLNYQKGYDIAISALAILRQKGYDADWFVLGEGSLQKDLQKQIAREGLTEHFILLGSKTNPYPYYRQADLYMHCTRFEGKSIAIEEAQILGKAIIASDCTGNREQITDGISGRLIPLTAEAIADTVAELLEAPEMIQHFEQASKAIDLLHPEDYPAFFELL